MSGIHLSDLGTLSNFISAVIAIEEQYGLDIIVSSNAIWQGGTPIARFYYDSAGELRVGGPE